MCVAAEARAMTGVVVACDGVPAAAGVDVDGPALFRGVDGFTDIAMR